MTRVNGVNAVNAVNGGYVCRVNGVTGSGSLVALRGVFLIPRHSPLILSFVNGRER